MSKEQFEHLLTQNNAIVLKLGEVCKRLAAIEKNFPSKENLDKIADKREDTDNGYYP
jgi:hypothetical protein